jgi:hypothetical protein
VTGLTAALVSHGLATLIELQTVYSYGDAQDLYEILTVRGYNEWLLNERAKRR